MSSDPIFKKYEVPTKIVNDLYESSGKSGAYKGIIVAYCTESGEPVVFSRCDSKITEMGLKKCLEEFLAPLEITDEIADQE
jgi:hypothetical protein|tara:strand:- start:55 stop:297 length:243 start_codon:yes stop_codon:yes gene_type:complete